MKIDGNREYELLKKISFIRTAWSSEEMIAAYMIRKEVSDTIINAVNFPEKRELPQEMTEAVGQYLYKKDLAESKENDEQ